MTNENLVKELKDRYRRFSPMAATQRALASCANFAARSIVPRLESQSPRDFRLTLGRVFPIIVLEDKGAKEKRLALLLFRRCLSEMVLTCHHSHS